MLLHSQGSMSRHIVEADRLYVVHLTTGQRAGRPPVTSRQPLDDPHDVDCRTGVKVNMTWMEHIV